MKVAVVDQGFKVEFEGIAGTQKSVVNESGVLALHHPDPFFEQGVGEGVRPNGSGAFETETLEVAETLRVDGAAGPAMGCERIRGAAIAHGFIERGDELISAERRLKCCDKKAMVATRHACGDSSGGKTADTVGYEPLAGFGSGEIATDVAPELNCGRKHRLRFNSLRR